MVRSAADRNLRCVRAAAVPLITFPGTPATLGVSRTGRGHAFAIFCTGEARLALRLYTDPQGSDSLRLELNDREHRSGDVWHIEIAGLLEPFAYIWEVQRGETIYEIVDPYARYLSGAEEWPEPGSALRMQSAGIRPRRCWVGAEIFDRYDGPKVKRRPLAEQRVYELHVRGFTRDRSSGVTKPGTYAGLREKIGYLKELGVTAVEWMPCHEFDESENHRVNPSDGSRLLNYWGYDPIQFFAPKTGYAHAGTPAGVLQEIRETIAAFHEAGIEVWLDVVFNHTVERGVDGEAVCFRVLAPETYYLIDQDGTYHDHTGCGHTVNANHSQMRRMILDALTWWHEGLGFDGFRFDLAGAMTRDEEGELLNDPPSMIEIAGLEDLRDARLIAEVWDAAGAYRLGDFPRWGRWSEWNGRFRDDIRRFWRGDHGLLNTVATRMVGSPDLYKSLAVGPDRGVNYIACHDGATLRDLVTFAEKKNAANGEEDRDGDTHEIRCLRDDADPLLLIKALWGTLLTSQGPVLWFMGDERGATQHGNNNVWCQDNELGWMDWSIPDDEDGRFRQTILTFVRRMLTLREESGAFALDRWLAPENDPQLSVRWRDIDGNEPDWHGEDDRRLVLEWAPTDKPVLTVSLDAAVGKFLVR